MTLRQIEIFHLALRRLSPLVHLCLIELALVWTLSACSLDGYTAEPIEARVVDASSGAPLEGVSVVAAWESKGGLEGGNIEGYLEVIETTTDQDGMFRIPAWGPKPMPWYRGLAEATPRIMLFTPGYRYRSAVNQGSPRDTHVLRSDWNGKTIVMERFAGSPTQYYEALSRLRTDLGMLDRVVGDYWPQIPNFLCAGARLERELAAEGVGNALPSYELLARQNGLRCPSQPATDEERRK